MYKYLIIIYLILPTSVSSQQPAYGRDIFSFPIQYHGKNNLSSNMSEIRKNHFHSGIDIQAGTGTPVYAIADGFVSRLKSSSFGYGNVIYITHPATGHISVYAHLSKFNNPIGRYIRKKQYEQENFEVHLFPAHEELPVKKGDLIAYVGNTGFSFGSHLHFEIRNLNDNVLDPFLFFPYKDHIPPTITYLGIVPLTPESRINGLYEPHYQKVIQDQNGNYQIQNTIHAEGLIGLEVITFDKMDGSSKIFGTPEVQLKINDTLLYAHKVNNFSFDDAQSMNAHINYLKYLQKGYQYQKCYIEDGNTLGIYHAGNGKINIQEGKTYPITLSALDSYQNKCDLQIEVKGRSDSKKTFYSSHKASNSFEINENALIIPSKEQIEELFIFIRGKKTSLTKAYKKGSDNYFIWNLQKGKPDSISIGQKHLDWTSWHQIPSGTAYEYENKKAFLHLEFPPYALFDTTYISVSSKPYQIHLNGNALPFQQACKVTYSYKKAGMTISDKDQWGIFTGNNYSGFIQPEWTDSTLTFQVQAFGDFYLKKDNIAPSITWINRTPKQLIFKISDQQSGIGKYKATLNGKFLLMEYDYKTGYLNTDPQYGNTLKGKFQLEVYDRLGNVRKYAVEL